MSRAPYNRLFLFAVIARRHYGVSPERNPQNAAGIIMSKKPLTSDELTELTTGLNKLAHNLWWTWDQGAQEIFQELSPRGWQNLYHNAVAVLHEVSNAELRR